MEKTSVKVDLEIGCCYYTNMKTIDMREVLKEHNGKWVALKPYSNEVVASDKDVSKAIAKAKKKGIETPVILKARPIKSFFIG